MHLLGQADPGIQANTIGDTSQEGEMTNELGINNIPSDDNQDDIIAGCELGADHVPSPADESGTCTAAGEKLGIIIRSELGATSVPSLVRCDELDIITGSELGATHVPSLRCKSSSLRQVHRISTQSHDIERVAGSMVTLDPEAIPFEMTDLGSVRGSHQGLDGVWDHVRQLQAGRAGQGCDSVEGLWNVESFECEDSQTSSQILPFTEVENIPALLGLAPKEIQRVGQLPDLRVDVPVGTFYDKVLPAPSIALKVNDLFTPDYFVALHNITAAAGLRSDGSAYPEFTPNHLGARMTLPHSKLNLEKWRHYLIGYDKIEICQMLEFGFPIGIDAGQELECKTRNHGSSYMWYSYVDKFITKEVVEGGIAGPYNIAPWKDFVISPLMTAHKKPRGRRTVFDATYGDHSVNNATPGNHYMGETTEYCYPKVEDYRLLVLKEGQGCFMWKRDLARYFLQLPMDPVDYSKVGMVWRGLLFFFIALAFGLRHSGLNGQRVTDAVAWILRGLGLESHEERAYNVENYVDDMGGVEATLARATAAFNTLGQLLVDLGLVESKEKAEAPTTTITYLGVEFDSNTMEMRVPADKLEEIKSEITRWLRKKMITKKELQSLLGKLFWVGKVVKHSRVFLGRMLEQLRTMTKMKDSKKVKLTEDTRKDILWWFNFLDHYNGIEIITNEDPIPLSYHQLLDTPHDICAGDATPVGGGAWHGYEYWCDLLPEGLQDPSIPIHVKEFWVLIVSAKLWGETWTGRPIVLYCDNDAVCDVVVHKKPRDPVMLSLLREFLLVVVTRKFYPVIRKISSSDNHIADFISRSFDTTTAQQMFAESGLGKMQQVMPKRKYFEFTATW